MKTRLAPFQQHLAHDQEGDEAEVQAMLDATLPRVGQVTMSFNALEVTLNSAICEAFTSRSDETGLLVLQGMQYSQKVTLYQRLSDALHVACSEVPLPYDELVDHLKEAGRLRNLVIHADWGSQDAEGYAFSRMRVSAGGLQQEYVQLTPEAMDDVSVVIAVAHDHLADYMQERSRLLAR